MQTHEGEGAPRAAWSVAQLKAWRVELLRFFRRKVAADDVEDLAQQAWLAMARTDPARIHSTLHGFLWGVARHVLYEHFRRRRHGPEFDPEVDRLVALAPSVTQQLARRQDVGRIEAALRELPLELQLLFEAHHFAGMTGPALAAAFGLAEGTVRSRLARARRLVDERLADTG